jgi:homopolymeric O-antigen transport system ATP-binding protein
MSDIAIKAEHVSKKFCKSLRYVMTYGAADITRDFFSIKSKTENLRNGEFWAVNDVSFELKRGEALGIIGPNGSGKSTVLKMLNGIYMPDRGKLKIEGRVGALIEVGAGFHPMLTGRENVYVNGTILGLSKTEIDKKFEEIVDFADIGDFLDSPVKHYSSGMFIRLGFAVAVHCDPDILLVDEVLAVGDAEFNLKCYQKIQEIKKRGTTIILVSHNEYTIREQTSSCLYLRNGKLKFLGASEDGISKYIREALEHRELKEYVGEKKTLPAKKKAELKSLNFFDENWNEVSFIESGQTLNVILDCEIKEELKNPIFGVNFYGNSGFMYCANSYYENINFEKCLLGNMRIKIHIPYFHLPTNNYRCSVTISEESVSNLIDWHDMAYNLVVGRNKNSRGSIKLPTKWKIEVL